MQLRGSYNYVRKKKLSKNFLLRRWSSSSERYVVESSATHHLSSLKWWVPELQTTSLCPTFDIASFSYYHTQNLPSWASSDRKEAEPRRSSLHAIFWFLWLLKNVRWLLFSGLKPEWCEAIIIRYIQRILFPQALYASSHQFCLQSCLLLYSCILQMVSFQKGIL